MEPPRAAARAPSDALLELVQSLKRSLSARRESPPGTWVEEVAEDLRNGRRPGWYLPPSSGGGLAFYAPRGRNAFAHVHVDEGPAAVGRAVLLTTTLLDALDTSIAAVDVGFTGLSEEDEHGVLEQLERRPGSMTIERDAIERPIGPGDEAGPGGPPSGLLQVPLSDVTLDALADLDHRAFEGTVDELLIGPTLEDHRRVMEALVSGGLGRFLGEASAALIAPEPPRLVGLFLAAEQSPRRAVLLSFLVDPRDRRKGYGRYLLRWGFRALRALGYESVHLWVTGANRAARALYDSVGFRPFASAVIYRWERPVAGTQPHSPR